MAVIFSGVNFLAALLSCAVCSIFAKTSSETIDFTAFLI
jgi:hypothetical protein